MKPESETQAKLQRMRLRRLGMGAVAYLLMGGMIATMWGLDYLAGVHLLVFLGWVALCQCSFFALIHSGLNLRLRDPSLTTLNVLLPSLGSVYVMSQLDEPLLRMPFLMMGAIGLLYGSLTHNLREMSKVSGGLICYYLSVVVGLAIWAPERVSLVLELIILFSYSLVLVQTMVIAQYITALRNKLLRKNQDLASAAERLEDLATRDVLTRLPNRRAAISQLEAESARQRRRKPRSDAQPLCIALLDVDHFKHINDNYGHSAGDEVLKAIGATLQASIRECDFVARYGGEEFVAALPNTSVNDAAGVLERIRAAIEALDGQSIAGLDRPITLSIGLAAHQSSERIEQTLAHADAALYRAKAGGRNQIQIDDAALERPRLAS